MVRKRSHYVVSPLVPTLIQWLRLFHENHGQLLPTKCDQVVESNISNSLDSGSMLGVGLPKNTVQFCYSITSLGYSGIVIGSVPVTAATSCCDFTFHVRRSLNFEEEKNGKNLFIMKMYIKFSSSILSLLFHIATCAEHSSLTANYFCLH